MTKRGRFDSSCEQNQLAVCAYRPSEQDEEDTRPKATNLNSLSSSKGNEIVLRTERDRENRLYELIGYFLYDKCKVPNDKIINDKEVLAQLERYCIQLKIDFQPVKLSFQNKYVNYNILSKILRDNNAPTAGLRSGFRSNQRLNNEFEILKEIGKGGFGSVFKVRHGLDEKIYAVKKIEIDPASPSFDKMRREVTLASQFAHKNIVKYVTSWVDSEEIEKLPDIIELSTDSQDDLFSDVKDLAVENVVINSGKVYEWEGDDSWGSELSEDDVNKDSLSSFPNKISQPVVESVDESENSVQLVRYEDNGNLLESSDGLYRTDSELEVQYSLYIQMEYCTLSLRRYFQNRNAFITGFFDDVSDLTATKSTEKYVNEAFDIAFHIVSGLDFLHKKGVIHRDIKPENILWNEERKLWQICDFGLACQTDPGQGDPSEMAVAVRSKNLSSGLGTVQYAAPEQRRRTDYNCLVDVYSTGFVIFEAFYPVGELGDRIRKFELIRRERRLPSDFEYCLSQYCELAKAKAVTKTIEAMVSYDSHFRPSAQRILLSNTFLQKDPLDFQQEILKKDRLIQELDVENRMLKLNIADKDELLKSKDGEIQRLKALLESKN